MLAALGFTTTGILFGIFAYRLRVLQQKQNLSVINNFAAAYILLGLAFLIWGAVSIVGDLDLLALSVIAGDALLLAATILMSNILFAKHRRKHLFVYGLAAAGVSLFLVRAFFFYPMPFMTDGILFFNSQRLVSFTITFAFLMIWLPVNLRMATMLTQKTPSLAKLYSYMYTTATLAAVIFILAKAPMTVALSFTAISVSFLMLIISNEFLITMKGAHGRQRTES
ncbi:hypothetical protein HY003_01270 [Candidatus Saccharibacteria bacterium]|nr:hypothetical protein [Candidatus Saccharibacteria bacterium]MBI3337908.1 hypothetical protein [Candidatus Saccharibacteria bacterium]